MKYAALIAALALTACAPHVRLATPPPELLTCAPEPDKPDLAPYDWAGIESAAQTVREAVAMAREMVTARDRAEFDAYLAMRSAWGDCAADVTGVRAWAGTVE